jgi:mercuric ion binding protein
MRQCLFIAALLMLSFMAQAAERRYELYVDGMACPYCAYGIEKKIKAIDGVDKSSVEIKLNDGLVIFEADTPEPMDQASLKTLINDSGFTLRQFQVQPSTLKQE